MRRSIFAMLSLLAGCVASQTGKPTGLQPATDTLLTAGDIQVAQEHLRAFGFDPGRFRGCLRRRPRRRWGRTRPAMACRSRGCSMRRPGRRCSQDSIKG